MRFESPWFLVLIALIPLLKFLQIQYSKTSYILYSSTKLIEAHQVRQWYRWLPLRELALLFLILALARPQSGRSLIEVVSEGVDIMLAVDTSGSMQALDLKVDGERVTRLDAVKVAVEVFINNRTHDRLGLAVFGEEAFTHAPLTRDHNVLKELLKQAFIGMAGQKTAIGSAIVISAKRLKDLDAKERVMILLTDGENTAGQVTPLQAAKAAKELGIRIYTIGIGSEGRAPIKVPGLFGEEIRYVNVRLDEKLLYDIAQETGGQYFRVNSTEELNKVYLAIDELEKTEAKTREYHEYQEQFHVFLWVALAFFVLEVLLVLYRRKIY